MILKTHAYARSARNGGNGGNGCKLQSKVGLDEDALFGGMGEVLFILGAGVDGGEDVRRTQWR